jgi:hypothetical protein
MLNSRSVEDSEFDRSNDKTEIWVDNSGKNDKNQYPFRLPIIFFARDHPIFLISNALLGIQGNLVLLTSH